MKAGTLHFVSLLFLFNPLPTASGQDISLTPSPAPASDTLTSNLPLMVIDTHGQEIPDEPKIVGHMGVIDNGAGALNSLADPFNHYDGPIGIEVRGSSSQFFPKQSYAVELRDTAGGDVDASLLGLPAEEDWVLHGPYSDKSLMRNALIYHLANRMGRYAPRTRFVELVIDEDYRGIYVLMERIKRDPVRVDIAKLNPDETAGDDLTGGYIVKIDKTSGQEVDGWISPYPPQKNSSLQIFYQYHYPKPSEIVPAQANYIRNVVTAFEAVMAGPDFDDPETGYARHIDVDAAIDFYLLNEMARNVDGYRLSTFLHKDKDSAGGKLVFGPIWDFNLGFGNADYYNGASERGFQSVLGVPAEDYFQPPFWWARLWQEPAFNARAAARWHALRAGPLHNDSLMQYIDTQVNLLGEAAERNFERWQILGTYVWPNAFIGASYSEEAGYLKNWLNARLAWLDENLEEPAELPAIQLPPSTFEISQIYPNPARNAFKVTLQSGFAQPFRLELFDMMGRRVVPPHEAYLEANVPLTLDVPAHNLARGIYLVRFLGLIDETTAQVVIY